MWRLLKVRNFGGPFGVYRLGRPPHPVIVTIGDNRDYIRLLLYSYYTTITGWGFLLIYGDLKSGGLCPK